MALGSRIYLPLVGGTVNVETEDLLGQGSRQPDCNLGTLDWCAAVGEDSFPRDLIAVVVNMQAADDAIFHDEGVAFGWV